MKSETYETSGSVDAKVAFQSTHSMKSETQFPVSPEMLKIISIHSLNEEWDNLQHHVKLPVEISIHSLNEEWDKEGVIDVGKYWTFQSTHSMKSETVRAKLLWLHDFISIHSLNEEWDLINTFYIPKTIIFQSTHSMKSETSINKYLQHLEYISIHSLNEEWD